MTIYNVTFIQNNNNVGASLMIEIPETATELQVFTGFPTTTVQPTNPFARSGTQSNTTPKSSATSSTHSNASPSDPSTPRTTPPSSSTIRPSTSSPFQDNSVRNIFLNVSFATFCSNSAESFGSAVSIYSNGRGYQVVNLYSVAFVGNQAASGSAFIMKGSGVNASLTMISCNLSQNLWSSPQPIQSFGGAISLEIESLHRLMLREVNITENSGVSGGALRISAKYVNSLTIANTIIVGNRAGHKMMVVEMAVAFI